MGEARAILEERLDEERLYQVRESARITYYRHVVPAAMELSRQVIEDALPLFIMYASNAAENASILGGEERGRLVATVYGALAETLQSRREAARSPIMRGVARLREIDSEGEPRDLGAYYSLLFAVLVTVQVYVSGLPVMRLGLAPLYSLARASLERLDSAGAP